MFELNPLAAALQGIGYGSLLTALQGLWAVTVVPPPLPIESPGAMAAFRPRRRVRRVWLPPPPIYVPPPAGPTAIAPADEEEEDAMALAMALA